MKNTSYMLIAVALVGCASLDAARFKLVNDTPDKCTFRVFYTVHTRPPSDDITVSGNKSFDFDTGGKKVAKIEVLRCGSCKANVSSQNIASAHFNGTSVTVAYS